MPTNFILVDYQNVRNLGDLAVLDLEDVRVVVFLGKTETKIPTPLAMGMQELGDRATYVQIEHGGKNALDFVMAYHLGRLAKGEGGQYFHIISVDKGFDALTAHVKGKWGRAFRWDSLAEVPFVEAALAKTTAERATVFAKQKREKTNRPKSLKTLLGSFQRLFTTVGVDECERIEAELRRRKYHKVEGEVVSYPTNAVPVVDSVVASNGKSTPVAKVKKPAKKTPKALAAEIVEKLGKPKATRPATIKSFRNHFASALTDSEFEAVMAELRAQRFLSAEGEKVTYLAVPPLGPPPEV